MSATVQATALLEAHEEAGARMVHFAGWRMPLQYSGVLLEHRAVRGAVGLFDLSHMAEIELAGPAAGDALAWALVGDARRLAVGRAQYSMICAVDGGVLDDLIVYRLETERYLVVANAANAHVVLDELVARSREFGCQVTDRSAQTTLIALQGPRSQAVLQPWCTSDLSSLRYYSAEEASVCGIEALVARTGYTGEDGFELFVAWEDGPELWRALMESPGRCRSAWERVTRCAWRPACRSTARSSTDPPTPTTPAWGGSSSLTRRPSSAATLCWPPLSPRSTGGWSASS